MKPRLQIATIYLLSLVAAMAMTYLVMRVQAGAVFTPGPNEPASLRIVLAPLAGAAGFAIIYGLLRGRALRGRFWLLALGVLVVMWFATFMMISVGVPVLNAVGLPIIVLIPAGLAIALRAEGV